MLQSTSNKIAAWLAATTNIIAEHPGTSEAPGTLKVAGFGNI